MLYFYVHWYLLSNYNIPQYYRKARQMALHSVYPELALEEEAGVGRLSYPRPLSEPPSPTSSRATTPVPSDDEDNDVGAPEHDEVDEEREVFT